MTCCRYGVIRSLLRVLVDGQAAKDVLDVAVDANSAMQNLREAIAGRQPHAVLPGSIIVKPQRSSLLWHLTVLHAASNKLQT